MFPDDQGGDVYDNFEEHYREPITREELPNLSAERRIFDGAGYEIPRRNPRFLPDTVPFGGLIDFSKIHEMFATMEEKENNYITQQATYDVYPQAGLVTCGHLVAKGLMYPFIPFMENLNESIRHSPVENEVHDYWARNELEPAVIGIGCQMYNSLMHNTRGNSTQHHGVVLGNVTAALAGQWARNTNGAGKARDFVRTCDKKLPHEEYIHKIKDRSVSRDLRVENVFGISMGAIHPKKRNGRYAHVKYLKRKI